MHCSRKGQWTKVPIYLYTSVFFCINLLQTFNEPFSYHIFSCEQFSAAASTSQERTAVSMKLFNRRFFLDYSIKSIFWHQSELSESRGPIRVYFDYDVVVPTDAIHSMSFLINDTASEHHRPNAFCLLHHLMMDANKPEMMQRFIQL